MNDKIIFRLLTLLTVLILLMLLASCNNEMKVCYNCKTIENVEVIKSSPGTSG